MMMTHRFLVSLGAALPVTFTLLLLMQLLITTHTSAPIPDIRIPVDFLDVREDTEPEKRIERISPPEPVEVQPVRPTNVPDHDPGSIKIVTRETPVSKVPINIRNSISDGEPYLISAMTPVYPIQAVRRNLEGFVVLEFTITKAGSVTDIRVVESTSTIFEKSAVQAASKFKYRARVVAGEPVATTGIQFKLSFSFDD